MRPWSQLAGRPLPAVARGMRMGVSFLFMVRHSESHGHHSESRCRATPAAGRDEDVASNWVVIVLFRKRKGDGHPSLSKCKMRMKTVKIFVFPKALRNYVWTFSNSGGAASVGVC